MPKQTAKGAAASVAAKRASASPRGSSKSAGTKAYDFPLTTMRDVEQSTYTAERAERLRQGNVSYSA